MADSLPREGDVEAERRIGRAGDDRRSHGDAGQRGLQRLLNVARRGGQVRGIERDRRGRRAAHLQRECAGKGVVGALVVRAGIHQVDEVLHRVGREVVEQLEVHLALVGDDLQHLIGLGQHRGRQVAAGGVVAAGRGDRVARRSRIGVAKADQHGRVVRHVGRRGEHGQPVGRRHGDVNRAQRLRVARGAVRDGRRERGGRAGLVCRGRPGEGVGRRIERHARGQRRPRRHGYRVAAGRVGLQRIRVDLPDRGGGGGRRGDFQLRQRRGRGGRARRRCPSYRSG